jgi:RHS repeat-associated protein
MGWGKLGHLLRLLLVACMLGAAGGAAAASPGSDADRPQLSLLASRFEEPLVATGQTSPEEDEALAQAILAYRQVAALDDVRPLEAFLATYPHSGWRLALLTNLGLSYNRSGYFSKAFADFDQAWSDGQSATETHAKALADRAAGELLRMHVRLGHAEQAAALLGQLESRGLSGPATELRDRAKETLWLMRNDPNSVLRCGPAALKALLRAVGLPEEETRFLDAYQVGPQGTTLAEVGRLATQAGLDHRLVHRAIGEPVPVPSIVHWNIGHFAAILSERGGRYEIADTAGERGRLWVTRAALDAETSGYFLVLGTAVAAPWREATVAEASDVRGAMPTQTQLPSDTSPESVHVGGSSRKCPGMCGYSFTEMVVSLNLTDTPVGYVPPKGPPVPVTINYNQREAEQPANFTFFNVSPKWTLNWLSYIQDDPAAPGCVAAASGCTVTRYVAGGGSVAYSGYDPTSGTFTPESRDRSVLTFASSEPAVYRRSLPDGSVEVYGEPDGASTYPRRVFLTKLIDPAGNAATLVYDTTLRLTAVVDATGRSTAFAYGNASNPLLVTKITDPFGRSAQLAYDSSGRLSQITDVLGLTSKFSYDSSSLVNALTTPYGTTTFIYGDNGNQRYLQATDPLGQTERLEWFQGVSTIPSSDPANTLPAGIVNIYNSLLQNRNTFFWDKHVYALAAGDYTKARIKHWCEEPGGEFTSTFVDSIKNPLEGRVWTNYIGQSSTLNSGTFNEPIAIGRVLDDGSTQLTQFQYNGFGNPTSITDPVGRQTSFQYAANQIDVVAVQQTTGGGPVTTGALTYNAAHRPLTYTDAAGQTTHFAYNGAGQVTQVTDALGHVTAYSYNALGYLTTIVNANGKTAASFTYDNFGRVATRTDSEGWTVAFAYDALDRVTKETYPDATTRVFTYKNLDLVSVKDRQGRVTSFGYDAVRNLVSQTDPLGNVTRFGRYENGALKSLTDPNGHVTTWGIDVQGRVTGKTYADGTTFANTYEATTSRLHAVTDPLGQTTQYAYALDDRPTAIQYLNAVNATPSVGFTYDSYFPRLTSMNDGSGTTSYAYGPVGGLGALKLTAESPPFANSAIAYQYDAVGRMTARSVGGNTETLAYDALNRVTTHADDLGVFQRSYLGQTTQLTGQRSGFVGTTWSYDTNLNDRRLTAISNSPVASGFLYKTTPENDISTITETLGNQVWSYTYDGADRLKTAMSTLGPAYQYGYDKAGNLGPIVTPTGTTTVVSNALNQVTREGTAAFKYDANGNLLSDYARTYAWDAANRLIGIGYLGHPGMATKFRYDGLSRRIAIDETSGGLTGETRYAWCGETLCQARSVTDTVARRYFAEGEESVTDGSLLFYAVDHLGSVRDVIVAQNGLRVAHYDYAPNGAPTKSVGSRATWTDFRYGGLFYHQTSDLYLATHRAYDPVVGRWLSRDPIGEKGGYNLYAYVVGNPIGKADPSGNQSDEEPPGTMPPKDQLPALPQIGPAVTPEGPIAPLDTPNNPSGGGGGGGGGAARGRCPWEQG